MFDLNKVLSTHDAWFCDNNNNNNDDDDDDDDDTSNDSNNISKSNNDKMTNNHPLQQSSESRASVGTQQILPRFVAVRDLGFRVQIMGRHKTICNPTVAFGHLGGHRLFPAIGIVVVTVKVRPLSVDETPVAARKEPQFLVVEFDEGPSMANADECHAQSNAMFV